MNADVLVADLRTTFNRGRTKPVTWRVEQLRALNRLLKQESAVLERALGADLGKSPAEVATTETGFVANEIDHALRNLNTWLRPERSKVPAFMLPAKARVVREPLGVTLIIGAWNYPVQLTLAPLVGALAGGNCAIVKPSELSERTAAALARLLPKYLDPEAVKVVKGGVPETTALLEQRFDHIFFTGSAPVGVIVMTAAARHLTPVTLELGGKNPCIVEPGVDLAVTARRIVWGKFLNAGQTCVAPDYLLAVGQSATELESHLANAIREMYGPDPATSPDYGRIVSERHFDRVAAFLRDGRVVTGGQADRGNRYIAPTVLAEVDPGAPVMREEIFGPVLPIIAVPDLSSAITFVNERDKPLSLYAFTASEQSRRRLLAETSSGAVGFGLPAAHLAVPGLPFGGVGTSGQGAYHGKYSIDTFTHAKAVLDKPLSPDTWRLAYPPVGRLKERMLRFL
ncbi:aldehyde dehydrogenase (NAD+) [Nonomuraea soli]|uniref:Aldehyde dehydrogenase n=1 Tax=Nonomuraea soli TaxID=1032476 RepID=A0A7W0HTK0_9ACTN|nr:aldehyde dehydrogenase family protein [Nonomuraea soli]MBA2894776.1 aldehyde dehydrogenase (NAD+) [Nonomuraea soli]